jgi:hypothetical protein
VASPHWHRGATLPQGTAEFGSGGSIFQETKNQLVSTAVRGSADDDDDDDNDDDRRDQKSNKAPNQHLRLLNLYQKEVAPSNEVY